MNNAFGKVFMVMQRTASPMEITRRLTITERPVYEPDGYGFARRVEDKLFGMALAINKREQERKLMGNESEIGNALSAAKANLAAYWEKEKAEFDAQKAGWNSSVAAFAGSGVNVSASWASPETLTAQLRRLRFELQTTQTRLAEADKVIEKVLASL